MQLTRENKTFSVAMKNLDISLNAGKASSDDVKEKKSSEAFLGMNPVASGDNVTVDLNSVHKFKEELPPLVPCCEGKELQINPDVVHTGLSAISIKHDGVIHSLSLSHASEMLQVPTGLIKHRNSFRCLHRPDLKRVPYLRRMTPDELETLFRGFADLPSRGNPRNDNNGATRAKLPPDENMQSRELKVDEAFTQASNGGPLHAIPEMRSGVDDVPTGMRLHGARARLYTSVLAGAKAGDQLDTASTTEEYDTKVVDDPIPEDDVLMKEELQIILPPRCDDMDAITVASTNYSIAMNQSDHST